MNSQNPILRALRGRSGVSLPDPSRFSFSLPPNGPFNTPIIPTVYITSPEEEGNVTWCAVDGDAALSLDVPLPDIALLERTIDGLRKATTNASSHASMFRRHSKRDTVVFPHPVQEEPEDDSTVSHALESHTPRQQRVVFADANGGMPPESLPQRPRSPMRVPSPPPTIPKGGSLRMRASRVLHVLKPRRSSTFPLAPAPHSPSENRPDSPRSLLVSNGLFGSRRLRRGVSLILFKRNDPAAQPPAEQTPVAPLDSLGIFTLPHPLDQGLPSLLPTPFPSQHTELACPSLTPMSPDKPLPPLPARDPTRDAAYSTPWDHQSSPALSPPKQPKHRFSLTDFRHKWIKPSRTESSTSTADGSVESSGSSAATSSVEQDDSRRISRSPGRRVRIESMHFPNLDLRFDTTSF